MTLEATLDARAFGDGPAAALPATIGRYQIRSRLGEGGMGIVMLAIDPMLGRQVALKILRPERGSADARRRLLREAQGIAQLAHENVIVVHEVGTHDDRDYLVMEYVAGTTLTQWQVDRPWHDVLATYVRAGRGLAAAHAAGLVHRDFKPDNVLVGDDGRVRVTDFGMVAVEKDDARESLGEAELDLSLTRTGAIMGTPRYMAPEQHRGEGVDARADQFAFCVALFQALFDEAPFEGDTYATVAANVLAGAIISVPVGADVPAAIRDAILRGLRVAKEDRHASMLDLLAALTPAPPRRRRTRVLAASAIAIVALGVGVAISTRPAPVDATATELHAHLDVATLAIAAGETHFRAGDFWSASFDFDGAATIIPAYELEAAAALEAHARKSGDLEIYRDALAKYRHALAVPVPVFPPEAAAPERTRRQHRVALLEAEIDRRSNRSSTPHAPELDSEIPLRGLFVIDTSTIGLPIFIYTDDPAKRERLGTTPWVGLVVGPHRIVVERGADHLEAEVDPPAGHFAVQKFGL